MSGPVLGHDREGVKWPGAGRQNAMNVAQVAQLLQSRDRQEVPMAGCRPKGDESPGRALNDSASATRVSPSAGKSAYATSGTLDVAQASACWRPHSCGRSASNSVVTFNGAVISMDVQKLRYRSLAVTAQYGAAVTFNGSGPPRGRGSQHCTLCDATAP